MRTNIMLDDKLVEKGMKYTGIKTKKSSQRTCSAKGEKRVYPCFKGFRRR